MANSKAKIKPRAMIRINIFQSALTEPNQKSFLKHTLSAYQLFVFFSQFLMQKWA